jgi:hypothetical protein
VRDEVRLLGKTGGYTDNPVRALDRDEPEAVSRADQARITAEAVASWPHMNALHEGARTSQPLDRRLARCVAQAKHLRVDVHGELRLVRLALQGGRSRAHVERRLEVLEERLWPNME